jgi:hypothetical protein
MRHFAVLFHAERTTLEVRSTSRLALRPIDRPAASAAVGRRRGYSSRLGGNGGCRAHGRRRLTLSLLLFHLHNASTTRSLLPRFSRESFVSSAFGPNVFADHSHFGPTGGRPSLLRIERKGDSGRRRTGCGLSKDCAYCYRRKQSGEYTDNTHESLSHVILHLVRPEIELLTTMCHRNLRNLVGGFFLRLCEHA